MWDRCYPRLCLLCRQRCLDELSICAHCRVHLAYLDPLGLCQGCAMPVGEAVLLSHRQSLVCSEEAPLLGVDKSTRCGKCQQDPFFFDRAFAMFAYQDCVVDLICQLKFFQQLAVAKVLGQLFAEHLRAYHVLPWPALIIPVPVHRNRLWQRGFNQTVELAKPVSRALGIPMDASVLSKAKSLIRQSSLGRSKRLVNVAQAFEVKWVGASHVVLLDDVMATGATVNEATKVLKQAGVSQVDVWAIARAV